MPATIKLNVGKGCQIEIVATSPIDAVDQLAAYQEILSISECGKCKSTSIKLEHRLVEGNHFRSWRCMACRAQLDFGQHKTGDTLFVKQDKGWYIFERDK